MMSTSWPLGAPPDTPTGSPFTAWQSDTLQLQLTTTSEPFDTLAATCGSATQTWVAGQSLRDGKFPPPQRELRQLKRHQSSVDKRCRARSDESYAPTAGLRRSRRDRNPIGTNRCRYRRTRTLQPRSGSRDRKGIVGAMTKLTNTVLAIAALTVLGVLSGCSDTTDLVVDAPPVAAEPSAPCYAPSTKIDGDECFPYSNMPIGPFPDFDIAPDSLWTDAELAEWDAEIEALAAEIRATPMKTDPPATASTTTTTAATTSTTTSTTTTTVPACAFTGFFSPVDNTPTVNVVKAGAAVPVKFGFCRSGSLQILATGSPSSTAHPCGTAATDEIEFTVTVSTSGLTFDPATGRYQYNWKTDKSWTGHCRTFTLRFTDGTIKTAEFKFR
jgi:hypothetical protein